MSPQSTELTHREILARAARERHLTLDDLVLLRQRELHPAATDLRTQQERDEDAYKELIGRGEKIAQKAIGFLFGSIESHWVEFHVGHLQEARDAHGMQHEAYLGRLSILVDQGVIAQTENRFVVLATGRSILREELLHDDETGNPGVVRYISDVMHEEMTLGAQEDAMRLIAEA